MANPSPLLALGDVCSCYLNTNPDEILRVVISYLSRRSQHSKWHLEIFLFLVISALDVGWALAPIASQKFHSTRVSRAFFVVLTSICLGCVYYFANSLFIDLSSNSVEKWCYRTLPGCKVKFTEVDLFNNPILLMERISSSVFTRCRRFKPPLLVGKPAHKALSRLWSLVLTTMMAHEFAL